MHKIKRCLAMLLCMLLMLTPVVATPAITTEAARNTSISFTDMQYSYNKATKERYYQLTAEVGQNFNIGDYIQISGSSKISMLSKVSKTATYKSSNSTVASINKKGTIIAKQLGNSLITIKYKGKTLKCNLVVTEQKYSTNAVILDYKASLDAAGKKYNKFSAIKASNCYAFVNTLTSLYVKATAVETTINNNNYNYYTGLLLTKTIGSDGYVNDYHIVVTNGNKFDVLSDMLNSYYLMNNPFNSNHKYSSQLQIKNVTANATGITLNLKKQVTQAQVFGALQRYSLSHFKSITLDSSYAVYTPISVYKMKQNVNGRYTCDYDYKFNYITNYKNNISGYTYTYNSKSSYASFYTYLKAGNKTLTFAPGSESVSYSYYSDGSNRDVTYSNTYEPFTTGMYRAYIGNNSRFYVDFTVQ